MANKLPNRELIKSKRSQNNYRVLFYGYLFIYILKGSW